MTRTLITVLALALPTTAFGADRVAEDYLGSTVAGTAAYEISPVDVAGELLHDGGLALELDIPLRAPRGFSSGDGWDASATLVATAALGFELDTLAVLQGEAWATGDALDLDAAVSEAGDAITTLETSVTASWALGSAGDSVPGVVDVLVLPAADVETVDAPSPDQPWLTQWLESYPEDLIATHVAEQDGTAVVVMASDTAALLLALVVDADRIEWEADALDGLLVKKGFEVLLDDQEIPSHSFEGGESQSEQAGTTSGSTRCTDPRGCR